MKNFFKKIIIFKLNCLAKIYLWRFRPDIIAITGNVGKTSTKEAVAAVLSKVKKLRSGKGNLNNEFGVPLTIVGDWADDYYEAGNSFIFWCRVLLISFVKFFFTTQYPEILVLEYGADKPGDISKLVEKYSPKIGIVTAIGEIPVHVEYFSDPDNVAREKSKLISMLKSTDYAILNHDDQVVYEMKEKTRAKVMSYGFTEGSTIQLSNFDFRLDENQNPEGVSFKIHHGTHTFVPAIIHGVLGKSQAFAAGAATCVGIIYGMNLIEISEALSSYKSPNGRLKILKGIKNTIIIDDTYNAAPASMHLALDTLKELPAKRKIAVLGDMLELGKYMVQAHQEIGNLAGGNTDVLVTIGLSAKFIADSARRSLGEGGFGEKRNIYSFATSDLAKFKIQELLEEGDLVLIKGSQGMRMEKIVEEIIAEPDKKKELLVRQGKKWLNM